MDTPVSENTSFIEPTLGPVIAIWWAWFWRTWIFASLGIFCVLVVTAAIIRVSGIHFPLPLSPEMKLMPKWVTLGPPILVGLFSQLWSFQQVLREVTFKKFSIRLVKSS